MVENYLCGPHHLMHADWGSSKSLLHYCWLDSWIQISKSIKLSSPSINAEVEGKLEGRSGLIVIKVEALSISFTLNISLLQIKLTSQ